MKDEVFAARIVQIFGPFFDKWAPHIYDDKDAARDFAERLVAFVVAERLRRAS